MTDSRPVAATPPDSRHVGWFMHRLPVVTLCSVITITATSEFEFAENVLRLSPYIAWGLPLAVDTYVLAAFRTGRDIVGAMVVMAATLAAAVGSHLVTADGATLPPGVQGMAATTTMIVLVIVAWRVHVLIETFAAEGRRERPAATAIPDRLTVPAATVPTVPVEAPTPDAAPTAHPVAAPVEPRRDEPATTRREQLDQTEWIVAKLTDDVRHGRRAAPSAADVRTWARALKDPVDLSDPRSRRIRDEITKRLATPSEHTDARQEA